MDSKFFVGNLPHIAMDNAHNDFVITADFQVVSAVVVRDEITGQAQGFGLVELAESEDAQRAVRGLG